jgi:hypothetical protein
MVSYRSSAPSDLSLLRGQAQTILMTGLLELVFPRMDHCCDLLFASS